MLSRRLRVVEEDLGENRADVIAGERKLAGEYAVQDDAHCPNVGSVVDLLDFTCGLLRAHVNGRTDHGTRSGSSDRRRTIEELGDAEVDQLDLLAAITRVGQDDVSRLEVTVNDPQRVGCAQCGQHLERNGYGPLERELVLPTKHLVEGLPVE